MPYRILILGASYGSLLGTKLLMAGHDVTLLCRENTARLINQRGTEVRIRLRDEDEHRRFRSAELPGNLDALTPDNADPTNYDLVCLAMQEPQYGDHSVRRLLKSIAEARVPCMSIMNMPPLPYLKRIPALQGIDMDEAFSKASVWNSFEPSLMTLCSPDPQAFRPPDEQPNVLHVGLPTNFKVAKFDDPRHNAMLTTLAADIDAVRVDGKDVPVKLRVHDSLFVPFAKWSMLATGNYRCITGDEPIAIREAVHADLELSREIYQFVDEVIVRLGADRDDLVPFEKYAEAAKSLGKPSSAARAVYGGSMMIERVDKLIQIIGRAFNMTDPVLNETIARIDEKITANQKSAA